jgi:uncharacterized spore protein YtfJ
MKLEELTAAAKETLTVRRVFGEPYERDGVAVIPAARVAGGGGGGGGHDSAGQEGEGGGFGAQARPAGVYVVRNGEVSWRPAVDVNRLFAVLGAVAITWLVTRARAEQIGRK